MPHAERRAPKGLFITFEGGEGTGKSTQARLLAAHLGGLGRDVVTTREPGGSPFAERVRELILDPAPPPHSALAEALLFYAARADHLDRVILPALARGAFVICDRFSDSTEVYQCFAGGLTTARFAAIEGAGVGASKPDLTLVLDLDPEVGLARARERGALSTYDARDIEFHRRLREGFLGIAAREAGRCVVIDASEPVDAIGGKVRAAVAERLSRQAE